MEDIIQSNKRTYIELSETEFIFDYKRLKDSKEEIAVEEDKKEQNEENNTNVHFNLSSFIERIIKNHKNKNASKGNGYNMNDPFLDDSELQENLNHERELENLDDVFYVDRINKSKTNNSKSKESLNSLEDVLKNPRKEIEEKSDDEDGLDDNERESIDILKSDIENELNSLEQYINYFHIDLKNDIIDERINSIDLLILKHYNQKRPKIYLNRLCSILKVNKKEIKKKLNEIETKNKMKEIEIMKESEIKELIKKMIKEYENQKIVASSEIPMTFKIIKPIRTEIFEVINKILISYEKLMKENNTIPENENFELSNVGKKIKNTIISEIVLEIPNELNVDERRIKDSLKNHKKIIEKSNRIICHFPYVIMRKLDFTVNK